MSPRVRYVALAGAVIALALVAWRSTSDTRSGPHVDVCAIALSSAIDREVEAWRGRARGEDVPQEDPAEIGRVDDACAPLYQEVSCREAMTARDASASDRVRGRVEACRDAYCPKLARRPRLCDVTTASPLELAPLWRELDDAILRHDLGSSAERIIEIRRRGEREITAALGDYFDAGSPAYADPHPGHERRALPREP